jgi:hypothetical protein
VIVCLSLWACSPPAEQEVEARLVPSGLEVRGSGPLGTVVVRDDAGAVVVNEHVGHDRLLVPVKPPPGGRFTVAVGPFREVVSAPPGPVSLQLQAPRGQAGRSVVDGDEVSALSWGTEQAALVVTAEARDVRATVRWGGEEHAVQLPVVGSSAVVSGPLSTGELRIEARAGEGPPADATVSLRVQPRTVEQARQALTVVSTAFPASPTGEPDPTRPVDTLVLPPAWLRRVLGGVGWGRARDDQAPWAHQALTLRWDGEQPLDVIVEATVVGEGAEAFAPRVRDATGLDKVVGAARLVPGDEVTVSLPLYVDRQALRGTAWTRRYRVLPLGARQPLAEIDAPLVLRRGHWLTWLGLIAAAGSSALGWAVMATRGPRWLASQPTSDLVTVAVFAALSYVVAGVLQVVGHGVAAVLGPFAPLLTALPDDALRACLLATLLTLVPRPGVAALATVTGALLRGLTLGSLHPVDLLYVGSAAFWLEAFLWLAGLTRSGAWRDEGRGRRWLRFVGGLGLANVAAMATGLCVAAALYRLYYAAWYVALLLAVPGFLYVALGCWVAVDLAASLRRVAS